ncbi:MAG: amidohydrolase [Lachnospiraceae bacterium]|nr:amidohydrolase [Lachnospiraceae bacterium]
MSRKGYYNCKVYTCDPDNPEADCFIVEDGRFFHVGETPLFDSCNKKIDLKGKCVIPGLVDSHCHFLAGVQQSAMNMLVIDSATKPEELGDALLNSLKENPVPPDKTIAAVGIDLTLGDFRAEHIDTAIPDRPVGVFSADGHALLLNSKAMELLNMEKDEEHTGLVVELSAMLPCMELFEYLSMDDDERQDILRKLVRTYNSMGYTTVFDAMSIDNDNTELLSTLKSLDRDSLLKLRIVLSFGYHGSDVMSAEDALHIMKHNRENFTSKNVFPDTLKLISDGTVEEHSALLTDPYSDELGGYGEETVSEDDMRKMADLTAKEGFSVHIHAIGDEAVKRSLDILTSLKDMKGTRTIAHNQLYGDKDIERMIADKGIFFQTTPHWMLGDEHTLNCLGEKRFNMQFPIGTMVRNGVKVSFGSDCAYDDNYSNPFRGMYYACARGSEEYLGNECLPPASEAISRMDALKAYTINGAEQLNLGSITGSISAGKSADFVITDRDIITCSLSDLKDTKVESVYFKGKLL